jgi:hypothetical protein
VEADEGTPIYGSSNWELAEAEADYTHVPSREGAYSIEANHLWSTEWATWYYVDGQSHYTAVAGWSVNFTNLAGQTWHSGNTYTVTFYGNLLWGLTPDSNGCEGQHGLEPGGWLWDGGTGQLSASFSVYATTECQLEMSLGGVSGYAVLEPPPPDPPTISTGNSGIWYLGSASVNDNCAEDDVCYYNNTVVTLTPGTRYTGDDTATWTLADPQTGLPSTFATYTCSDDRCRSITVSLTSFPTYCSTGGNIKVQGMLGSLSSNFLTLVADFPYAAVFVGLAVRDQGVSYGWYSQNRLQLMSACMSAMFTIHIHEEFPEGWTALNGSSGWTDPIPQTSTDPVNNPPWAGWRTSSDGTFTDHMAYTCPPGAPCYPAPLRPPDPPLEPQGEAVSCTRQVIFVGSKDTTNLGKYVPVDPHWQVRYVDHGRDQPSCPDTGW